MVGSRGHPHNGRHLEPDENHELADVDGMSGHVDGHPVEAENFGVAAEVDNHVCPLKWSMA